jgi:hypothetical protein
MTMHATIRSAVGTLVREAVTYRSGVGRGVLARRYLRAVFHLGHGDEGRDVSETCRRWLVSWLVETRFRIAHRAKANHQTSVAHGGLPNAIDCALAAVYSF